MYDSYPFEHNGKKYEIRSVSDGHKVRLRAFLDGKPANGYTYAVEILTQVDAKMSGSIADPIAELIETAINDVKSGIWEQYVAAVSSSGCAVT